MGKSKRLRKQRVSKTNTEEEVSSKSEINVDQLIKEAEAAIDCFNYEEASQKLNEVLSTDANNTKCLEMLAGVLVEQSNWLEAIDLLKKCTQLEPDKGFSKYFSLGQMHEGTASLLFYQKGIQLLEKDLENSENLEPSKESDRSALVRSLSDAYCSVVELYMTDLCFEENAENTCVAAIEAAIKADPNNSEAYQCQVNYLITKEQTEEAVKVMKKSLSLWLPYHEALRDGEEDAMAMSNDYESLIPTYDSRIQTSKLSIELEMYDEATKILDGLVEEDDEVAEVWYLLGWMNYIQGNEFMLNAHYYLNKAKEVCTKLEISEDDVDYVAHINEILEELKISHPLDVEENEELNSDIASDSDNEESMDT